MTPARESLARRSEAPLPAGDFCEALLAGFREKPKRIACKYFYDAEGSRLFERICALPEYYPTRTELFLLQRHGPEIAAIAGADSEIVEFGAGSSDKIRALLNHLERPRAYLPIDISGPYLRGVAARLKAQYPALSIHPVVADFTQPFSLPELAGANRVGFFPGSTIGNFDPEEARDFLARAAALLKRGGLLIGVDLVKDPALLHAAYNDRAGVTAAFNKNLLLRANREAGANFELARFQHYAHYNPVLHRIEMYLVSAAAQRVTIGGNTVIFGEGEAIHTEYSYKYTVGEFRALASASGFIPRAVWSDEARLFSIHWLETA